MPGKRDGTRRQVRAEATCDDALVVRIDGQPRHDADADPGSDEAVHRAVLIGAEDIPRLEPAGAEVGVDVHAASMELRADQRQARHLVQRYGLVALGKWGIGWDEKHPGVAHELGDGERANRKRQEREGEVELAAFDVGKQLLVGPRFDEGHFDVGPRGLKARHKRR